MKEVNPDETTRAYAFHALDESANAHGDTVQNAECVAARKIQPQERT